MTGKIKSFIFGLTDEKRREFDEMLRRNDYGGYGEALEWLRFYSVQTSRSALSRYSMELRKRDGILPGMAASAGIKLQLSDLQLLKIDCSERMDRIESKLDKLIDLLEQQ